MIDFFVERFGSSGFIGERLWLGHLGHFLILLSFFSSLLATVSYFIAETKRNADSEMRAWLTLGRSAFTIHGASVLGIFVLLFVMILNHMFEYHYAWRHSSTELPIQYIISSFWEGQEGSFLLWQFWLVIFGWVGIRSLKEWEQPVMGTISLTQALLGSMVLGIVVFGVKLGSNPFILLRQEMSNAPIFKQPNYLNMIADGNGLNPLLQNYWMTIHPPVLFSGFAAVSFPFAFAVASLLRADFDGWVKPALPWTLFSVVALGTGILMGGAWAYESLSFGGFWAWDPVENMSFVPWLFLVAGLHTHLIYRYTKHSLVSTFIFYILSFGFVLYSTFLTRSGILGDTSVHAFTDLGMTGQLLIYLIALLVPALVLLIIRYNKIPKVKKEEELYSREFWMFIGSLVLVLSAVQMTFTTSIPVWNILFYEKLGLLKGKLAPPEDVIAHYNNIQIWIAILAAMLTGGVQYLAYKSGKASSFFKWALYSLGISAVLAVAICVMADIPLTQQHVINLTSLSEKLFLKFPFLSAYFLFTLAAVFAVVGNLLYLTVVMKKNLRLAGASVTHFGFGLFLLGVILSQGKKEVISINRAGVDFGTAFDMNEKIENILLLRDTVVRMGDYEVTYKGTEVEGVNNYYLVNYIKRDKKGNVKDEFTLRPNAQINPKSGLIANPDTRHYLLKDVFTHVTSVPDNSKLRDSVLIREVSLGDTFYTSQTYVVFRSVNPTPALPVGFDKNNKLVVGAQLEVATLTGISQVATPVYWIDLNSKQAGSVPADAEQLGLSIDIEKLEPAEQKFVFRITEKEAPADFIIMKAIVFPFINLVWLGGIITFAGGLMSMYRRIKER